MNLIIWTVFCLLIKSCHENSMERIRTLFIGTPSFAIPSLEALLADSFFDVVGVVTQPDKPVGRTQTLSQSPIKKMALAANLPVYQPERIRNFVSEIESMKLDIIVLVAYGQIIPKAILDLPQFGCINVHGSLLPKYRGAAVIQAPIINGDSETGVTIMIMDEGLDTGPILAQAHFPLSNTETANSLFPKIATLGAQSLTSTLHRYINGGLKPKAQDEQYTSYVKILKKDDARIDWSKSAPEIERLTRAMNPWPVTWTTWNNKLVKIIEVEHKPFAINQYKPGQIFVSNGQVVVQCGINALIIKRLQLEGKTEMLASDFLRGQVDFGKAVLT